MTVLAVLLQRGYLEHTARRHLRYHMIKVDGRVVVDPNYVIDPAAQITTREVFLP